MANSIENEAVWFDENGRSMEPPKFKAPEPEPFELVENYFRRVAMSVEEWVNEHYPAKH